MIVLNAFIAIGLVIGILTIGSLFLQAARSSWMSTGFAVFLLAWGAIVGSILVNFAHLPKDEMIGSLFYGVIFGGVGLILTLIALIARGVPASFNSHREEF